MHITSLFYNEMYMKYVYEMYEWFIYGHSDLWWTNPKSFLDNILIYYVMNHKYLLKHI